MMRVIECMMDAIETTFGVIAEMLRVGLMLAVILLFASAVLYGLFKVAVLAGVAS